MFTNFFATIIFLMNPTFVPSLGEIGDLSCITSCVGFSLTHKYISEEGKNKEK